MLFSVVLVECTQPNSSVSLGRHAIQSAANVGHVNILF